MSDASGADRASQLLRWWTPSHLQEGFASTPLERLHALFFSLNETVMAARSQQVGAIASLNADLLILMRKAMQARAPQAIADVECEALDRMRLCAQSCCENWAKAAIECNALLSGHAEERPCIEGDGHAMEADAEEILSPAATPNKMPRQAACR